ncbi:leucine-rich repeat-containing protein [Nostoc cycadae WK-1]|uniref:Leucine-rich repeat-containing protein n=2 Tax=Nostoc cycadae TaxID=246795 RepID=A0A2H6LL86_9NOSO|nr:leucine-rich repeat-containing protein [Nostoc cycadae WK-1]
MSLIEKLTPEQEALIPVYRDKWRQIALSTERIDREKAAEAVKAVYQFMDFDEPEILFFDSPYAALKEFSLQLYKSSFNQKAYKIDNIILRSIRNQIHFQIESKKIAFSLYLEIINYLKINISPIFSVFILDKFNKDIYNLHHKEFRVFDLNYIASESRVAEASYIDFCISELNCNSHLQEWFVYQNLIKNCGWIFPDERIAIVCDRPIHIRFDNENRLHAEGEPAIEYADGYSLYSYNGVTLPEKYGKIHPQEWQAQWLLTETNAELRRVLIQGIGYSRICQDLQAIELDNWAGYTLLRIDNDFIDIEPILLLKMTCPSTGFIHVLRVPPNMVSARDAIRWINWGLEPDDFIIET